MNSLSCSAIGFAFILFIGSSVGCSVGRSGSAGNAALAPTLNDLAQTYETMVRRSDYRAAVETLQAASWQKQLQTVTAAATDAPYTFGGYSLSGTRSYYVDHAAAFAALQASYGTIGGYWQHLQLDPYSAISAAEINDGLAKFDEHLTAWRLGTAAASSSVEAETLLAKLDLITIATSLAAPVQAGSTRDSALALNSVSDAFCSQNQQAVDLMKLAGRSLKLSRNPVYQATPCLPIPRSATAQRLSLSLTARVRSTPPALWMPRYKIASTITTDMRW